MNVYVDVRVARDLGEANVVFRLLASGNGVQDPSNTPFTFDCNPCSSDQKYAANQQCCHMFAREYGIRVFDIDKGIGTHLVIDSDIVLPGDTSASTDSYANIFSSI